MGTTQAGGEKRQVVGRDARVGAPRRNQRRRIEGEITERGRF